MATWRLTALGIIGVAASGCMRIDRMIHPPPPTDAKAAVLQGEAGRTEVPLPPEVAADLAGAEQLYQQRKFAEARRFYGRVADDERVPPWLAEKARFHQAECQRQSEQLVSAMAAYNRMLKDFPHGTYRAKAVGHMYDIAYYWLKGTREEIAQEKAGSAPLIKLAVHASGDMPTVDAEGNALKYLEEVFLKDVTGPYAPKALWLCGYVNYYRGNYIEADHFLSELVDHYKDSDLWPAAVKLAIQAKNYSTGGPDYDGRGSAEALKLAHAAQTADPNLARENGKFFQAQVKQISAQQATKDFRVAEFYERTKAPGSAYFYYEIVRRRYPGTGFAAEATRRMQRLRAEALEKSKNPPGFFERLLR